ncbi:MAG: hypothetical protein ABEI32_09115 [Halothece sp.]
MSMAHYYPPHPIDIADKLDLIRAKADLGYMASRDLEDRAQADAIASSYEDIKDLVSEAKAMIKQYHQDTFRQYQSTKPVEEDDRDDC